MANEITVKAGLQCKNGKFVFPLVGADSIKVDQAGIGGGIAGNGPRRIGRSAGRSGGRGDPRLRLHAQHRLEPDRRLWPKQRWRDGGIRPHAPGGTRCVPIRSHRGAADAGAGRSEESDSNSAENQAKVQIYVLED